MLVARLALVLGLVLTIGGFASGVQPGQPASQAPRQPKLLDITMGNGLPAIPTIKDPVDTEAAIRENYEFVLRHPEVVKHMPCFCACAQTKGHGSVEDCYIAKRGNTDADVVWTNHAGECMICMTVAAETRRFLSEGLDVYAIRQEIEIIGKRFKYHTNTPMPPKSY